MPEYPYFGINRYSRPPPEFDQDRPFPAHPTKNPQPPLNVALRALMACILHNLRAGQLDSLQALYTGKAAYYWLEPEPRAITIIISPLKAIQNDQASDARRQFGAIAASYRCVGGRVVEGTCHPGRLRKQIARL